MIGLQRFCLSHICVVAMSKSSPFAGSLAAFSQGLAALMLAMSGQNRLLFHKAFGLGVVFVIVFLASVLRCALLACVKTCLSWFAIHIAIVSVTCAMQAPHSLHMEVCNSSCMYVVCCLCMLYVYV